MRSGRVRASIAPSCLVGDLLVASMMETVMVMGDGDGISREVEGGRVRKCHLDVYLPIPM